MVLTLRPELNPRERESNLKSFDGDNWIISRIRERVGGFEQEVR